MIILKDKYNSMRVTCPYCTSLLQLNAHDIQGGDVSEYFYKCGACKKVIILDPRQIPKQVLNQMDGD